MPNGHWRSGPTGRSPRRRCTRPVRTPDGRWAGHADGTAHLPRGVVLRLHESVTTDVERFASLAASDDPRRLLRAMQLVRGPLFDGLRRTDWAVFDGTQSDIESLVARTALRGADVFVRRGRVSRRQWMVRRALLVSPYDERLYRALLRATSAQGNRVGVAFRPWPSSAHWPARWAARLPGLRGGATTAMPRTVSIPRQPPSTVTCSRGRLPPEGTPPGCRVASRHGEKLFWEIGRPRRRNGRWRHLSRADAGELVCRARRDRPGRASPRSRWPSTTTTRRRRWSSRRSAPRGTQASASTSAARRSPPSRRRRPRRPPV